MHAVKFWKRLVRRRVQLTVLIGVAMLCMLVTIYLSIQVFTKLDRYGTASKDNIPWMMAQLEVDQLKFTNELERTRTPDAGAAIRIREKFDVFYSRTSALRDGRVYQQAFQTTNVQNELAMIRDTLDRMIPIIDADDSTLLAARDDLADATLALTAPIRRLSAAGIRVNASRAEAERNALTTTLLQVTALSLLMLATLLSLLWLFWRLYVVYRHRAKQNRVTLQRLETILNTSQDAIFVVTPQGQIVDTNGAAETLFRQTRMQLSGANISDYLMREAEDGPITPLSGEMLVNSCAKGPNRCNNLKARNADGGVFPVELAADMASRSGDAVCVCFVRDISRRRAIEAEMQSARDRALAGERAKASFLGMISHEMRTPLHGLLGALELMDDTGLDPDQTRYARVMKSSGQLLLNQINDALDITQADRGQLGLRHERFDLDELMDDLLYSQQPLADAHNTHLSLEKCPPQLGYVMGDRNRVHQVLLNLISNAIKYTQDGEITIETNRMGRDGDEIEFQISDTGIGISETDLPRIFDDFVRLGDESDDKTEGTGLGLGIARQLVVLMQGQISAESVEGEGSLFRVRIPLPRSGNASDTPPGTPEAQATNPLEILVVEDNPNNRLVLREMLEKDGHRVTLAPDGLKGIEAARDKGFDLILMDISMPGLDGIESTRRIRSGGASAATRIIALTAYFNADQEQIMRDAGIDGLRTKPLRRSTLRAILADTAPPPQDEAPMILDQTVLDQLGQALPDRTILNLIDGFRAEGAALLDDLPRLCHSTPQEAAMRVHTFAGAAATVGATALQMRLGETEAALKCDDSSAIAAALKTLPTLWKETLHALESIRRAA